MVAALLLALAACGSDGKSSGSSEAVPGATTTTALARPVVLEQCIQDVIGYGTAIVDAAIKHDMTSVQVLQGELLARDGREGAAFQVLFAYDTFSVATQRGAAEGTKAAVEFLKADAGPRCLLVLEEKRVLSSGTDLVPPSNTTSPRTASASPNTTFVTTDDALDAGRSCNEAVKRTDGGPPLGPVGAARCLYNAWKAGDLDAAREVAADAAVERLFLETWRPPEGNVDGCVEGSGGTFQCTIHYHDRELVLDAEGGSSVGYTIISVFFD